MKRLTEDRVGKLREEYEVKLAGQKRDIERLEKVVDSIAANSVLNT